MNENNNNTYTDQECITAITAFADGLYQAGFKKGLMLGVVGLSIGAVVGAAIEIGWCVLQDKLEERKQLKLEE